MNSGVEPRHFYRGVRYHQRRTYGSSDLNLIPRAKNKKIRAIKKSRHIWVFLHQCCARGFRERGEKNERSLGFKVGGPRLTNDQWEPGETSWYPDGPCGRVCSWIAQVENVSFDHYFFQTSVRKLMNEIRNEGFGRVPAKPFESDRTRLLWPLKPSPLKQVQNTLLVTSHSRVSAAGRPRRFENVRPVYAAKRVSQTASPGLTAAPC